MDFAKFLGPVSFYEVTNKEQIVTFPNKKINSPEKDPDKRCITNWNHYLNRIKLFVRWLYNYYLPLSQVNSMMLCMRQVKQEV